MSSETSSDSQLIDQNKVETSKASAQSLKEFLIHLFNYDIWICLLLVLITIPLTLFIPENAIESDTILLIILGVVRLIIGTIFVVFLLGYVLVVSLWPTKELGDSTRYGLSFILSIAIIPILGLILNFTPLGITLISILFTLTLFTLIILGIAFIRRYQAIFIRKR
jgi:uncharacterized membrane protein